MPSNWFLTLPGTLEKLQGNWLRAAVGKRKILQKPMHISAPERELPRKIDSEIVLYVLVPRLL